jgi:NhaA family Na+:H+ antiporter
MHEGALSTRAQAVLPLVAAAGGILAPALLYAALVGPDLRHGWAIPTATDIAFAVGVLAILGRRVSPALRVLLLAVAIADDIAAVLIIALVYADGVAPAGVAIAAAGGAMAALASRRGVNPWLVSFLPGAAVWYGLHVAGIHPALAGVVMGLVATCKPQRDGRQSPVVRLESALHPWVAFGVMPLFALANAGVNLGGIDFTTPETRELAAGIAIGLAVGKPAGIAALVAIAVRARVVALPPGVTPAGIAVIGCLGGIGFTMSIFIAALAFAEPDLLEAAKAGVLAGSAAAAIAGLALGLAQLRRTDPSR